MEMCKVKTLRAYNEQALQRYPISHYQETGMVALCSGEIFHTFEER